MTESDPSRNAPARIFSSRIVTPQSVVSGEIVIQAGVITDIDERTRPIAGALDWADDIIIPGLIDIHTDNLEKHYLPRPGALWDAMGAALAHDAQCAAAGITTVYDSLSLHGSKDGLDRADALGPMIAAMDEATAQGLLRADHLLHLRCEVPNREMLALLEPHIDNPRLRMLSVMDHTPGQRQTTNVDAYKAKLAKAGKSQAEIEEFLELNQSWRDASVAPHNRATVAALAREHGIPLASHDDTTVQHVDEAKEAGAVIAEFPVTLEAARRARELGLANVMGGPNFVRGGSHSGNLSARTCAGEGLLDGLTSDYVPLSMLRAAFMLTDEPFGWSLPDAIATVTWNMAKCSGLKDRGALTAGLRADLVRVARAPGGWPIPREVWREGTRVA
jgi:alpha-D-ribose 1-methylphosphonate 5-triphosphate diphosphatase